MSISKEKTVKVGLSESERVENAITKESMMKGSGTMQNSQQVEMSLLDALGEFCQAH